MLVFVFLVAFVVTAPLSEAKKPPPKDEKPRIFEVFVCTETEGEYDGQVDICEWYGLVAGNLMGGENYDTFPDERCAEAAMYDYVVDVHRNWPAALVHIECTASEYRHKHLSHSLK